MCETFRMENQMDNVEDNMDIGFFLGLKLLYCRKA